MLFTTAAAQTLLACVAVGSIGALAVFVLPWSDEELDASASAWHTLGALVVGGVTRLVQTGLHPTRLLPSFSSHAPVSLGYNPAHESR